MNKHNKEVAEILQDLLVELENEDRSVGIYAIPWQQSRIIRNIIKELENNPDPYDEYFGDDKICKCGHSYYRHFDSHDDMFPIGCKYCGCYEFEEVTDQIGEIKL